VPSSGGFFGGYEGEDNRTPGDVDKEEKQRALKAAWGIDTRT
jgi:hypothetical protein